MEEITIETNLSSKEILGLRYTLYFTNSRIIFTYLLGLILFFFVIPFTDHNDQKFRDTLFQYVNENLSRDRILEYISEYSENNTPSTFTYILRAGMYGLVFLLIYIPYIIYRSHLTSNKNDKSLGKRTYNFTDKWIIAGGETYKREDLWTSLYKIKELKNWFFLYITSASVYYIPKTAFNSEQLGKFRELLKTIEGPVIEIEGYSNKLIPALKEQEAQVEE